jgi:single-stranded-DNA-specific exonuclease
MLCGCAVAWKLACALLARLREADQNAKENSDMYKNILKNIEVMPVGHEKWYLDLVGISTIADMVPLQKENRALAHFGLKVLRKTKRPGLLHILNEQRMKKEFLTEDDIAFTIAPRINAASRMGDPIQAHQMLYETDRESAEGYARDLEELNTQRKGEVKDIVSTISFDHAVYSNEVIVVGDISWGPGILGLIAQKIIDETRKPVFVWGQGDDKTQVKGSCRSIGDVSVVDLMSHVGKTDAGGIFEGYGGHEGAGGFSLFVGNINQLSGVLNEAINHVPKKEILEHGVTADAVITIDDVNDITYDAIAVLAPFGAGNPKPIFVIKNPHVLASKWFGKKNEHFEVVYGTSKGGKVKAIQFFASKDLEEKVNKKHSPLVNLERSYFGGRVEIRMRLVEVE